MSNIFYQALLCCFVAPIGQAYPTAEPSPHQPSPRQKFVSSPSTRGTLDILFSSLFTIIACTWTIQHLNVPEQRSSCKQGKWGSLEWHVRKFCTKAQWMIITIIAPEVMVGMAVYDLLAAKRMLQKLQHFALRDRVPWTLTHTYFANMGAFVIESREQETRCATTNLSMIHRHQSSRSALTSEAGSLPGHENLNQSLRQITPAKNEDADTTSYNNPYHLTARQIWRLRKEKVLSRLPYFTKTELEDRSKNDSFVRVIALFQICWATTQIIVRAARKLSISQLELAVVAFAACATIMYGLYWSKPKSVGATTAILQGPIPVDVLQSIKCEHTYMAYFLIADDSAKIRHGTPIRNDATENELDDEAGLWVYLAMIFGATLFGGIHIGAWNFNFPTRIDLIVWRCASVYSTACGPIIILVGMLLGQSETKKGPIIGVQISVFFYVLARLALIVEIFRTLFFLPPDAYISTWTKDIPHFI